MTGESIALTDAESTAGTAGVAGAEEALLSSATTTGAMSPSTNARALNQIVPEMISDATIIDAGKSSHVRGVGDFVHLQGRFSPFWPTQRRLAMSARRQMRMRTENADAANTSFHWKVKTSSTTPQ